MPHDDLPLFQWAPTFKLIAFPATNRVGHARRIAEQLAKARTNREADHILNRPVQAYVRQLAQAGLARDEIDREHDAFLQAINRQCLLLNAKWLPVLDGIQPDSRGGGDAA